MSPAKSASKQAASIQVSELSGDIQMGCLNIQVLLDSITNSLDGWSDALGSSATHRRFDEINCYTACAKQILQTVLDNSLAMAKAAREVQQ